MAYDLINGEIPGHWEFTTLGEICQRGGGNIQTGPFGSQLHASDYVPVGVPSIMPTNIGENRIIEDGIVRITEEDANRLGQHRLRAGDIIYSRRGDVEKRALIREREEGWFCGTGCLKVRFGSGVVDPLFASMFLGHPAIREWIVRHAVGATMPNLNTTIMSAVPFALPPLAEQKAIAAILGALDDKIELNRRMNATLEGMARAMFQSWFVDFDPVRAKLDGRKPEGLDKATAALFPDAFQESSLGPVPKGWNAARVGEVSSRIAMGPFGSRITRDNFVPDGVPVVRGGNLTKGFVDDNFVFLTETKADELKASIARPLDIVFTHRGTLGQVGIIPIGARYPRYIVSQSQMLLSVDRKKLSPWAVYLFFCSPQGEAALLANTSTTGVPAISRPTTSLKAISLVIPPISISERFNELIQPLFLQREQLALESRTLATLRDTLLPKLLSGELNVASIPKVKA